MVRLQCFLFLYKLQIQLVVSKKQVFPLLLSRVVTLVNNLQALLRVHLY